ncbi:MAG: SpoIIE family protein phosphatase [Bacteroidota bacterium]
MSLPIHAQPAPITLRMAEGPELHAHGLTMRQGLSQNFVQDLIQDREGFVWIATYDALNRFDGEQVEIFRTIPFDSTSISSGLIQTVHEGPTGTIWAGTSLGDLNEFDPDTRTFRRLRVASPSGAPQILSIHETENGQLWVGTDVGLCRVPKDRTAESTCHTPRASATSALTDSYVFAVAEGSDGTLWAATRNGLNRMSLDEPGTFTQFHLDLWPDLLRMNAVPGEGFPHRTSLLSWREQWLVGTYRGLLLFDPTTGQHQEYVFPNPDASVRYLAHGPVDEDRLWAAVDGVGLTRIDLEARRAETFAAHPSNPMPLFSGHRTVVYSDASGIVWTATEEHGLNWFDPRTLGVETIRDGQDASNPLRNAVVWALEVTSDGALWTGTAGEWIHRIGPGGDVQLWQGTEETAGRSPRPSGEANAFQEDGTSLWVGTTFGLDRLDLETNLFDRVRFAALDSIGLRPNVLDLALDESGQLWVAAGEGLFRLSPGSLEAELISTGERSEVLSAAYALLVRAERVWVGLSERIVQLDAASGEVLRTFRHEPHDPSTLTSGALSWLHIRDREPDVLWAAGLGGGLDRIDLTTRHIRHYNTQTAGFPDNTIYAIQEDVAGVLYLSTNRGIVRFDPDEEEVGSAIQVLGLENGLQGLEFNQHASAHGAAGRMYFGGVGGVSILPAEGLAGHPVPPNVVLTGLRAGGADGRQWTASQLAREPSVSLRYKERDLTIGLIGLHYKNPSANRLRYRLTGYEEAWTSNVGAQSVSYTNLPPGDYTFEVYAANADGIWTPAPAQFGVTVRPPWWRTPWAYVLYALTLIGVIVATDRIQRSRLIRQERAKNEKETARLRTEAAEAYANFLQAENERQTQELESARDLQLSMLPETLPHIPGVSLAVYMQTATEVGGDYYDFFERSDNELIIAVGDATGHGARAGTMVTAMKALFSDHAPETDLPALLSRASDALRRMRLPQLYMAFALGRLRGRRLELVGAGLPPALIYRASSGEIERIPLKGLPLGAPLRFSYRVQTVMLDPGDTIVFMSDGLPELKRRDGEMIGYEETVALFATLASRSNATPQEIVSGFTQYAEEWLSGEPYNDDVTLVVLKVDADNA